MNIYILIDKIYLLFVKQYFIVNYSPYFHFLTRISVLIPVCLFKRYTSVLHLYIFIVILFYYILHFLKYLFTESLIGFIKLFKILFYFFIFTILCYLNYFNLK
ncbi:hypothetical protein SLOPH_1004 [Spraguea lophii 42_110]|uniref:Uncharacterized protein n=1 Tax=Spraguea lophii (strain 42_110) TaxID=1358809 RepID=S7XSE6_SPRLO|nr:hypothetical protein SLOPH_1004 [Spraguea lophii 42_110]